MPAYQSINHNAKILINCEGVDIKFYCNIIGHYHNAKILVNYEGVNINVYCEV